MSKTAETFEDVCRRTVWSQRFGIPGVQEPQVWGSWKKRKQQMNAHDQYMMRARLLAKYVDRAPEPPRITCPGRWKHIHRQLKRLSLIYSGG